MIVSKCPLRISLVGGSTDLQGFIDKFGIGSAISFPPNLYTYITINENIKTECVEYSFPTLAHTLVNHHSLNEKKRTKFEVL